MTRRHVSNSSPSGCSALQDRAVLAARHPGVVDRVPATAETYARVFTLVLVCLAVTLFTACSSSSSPSAGTVITTTSGTPQSTSIGAAFSAPLVATVTINGKPASGVSVIFTAPSAGASGIFATQLPGITDIETTNSGGVATSQPFTANNTTGTYAVTAGVSGIWAYFNLANTPGGPATISANNANENATPSAAFAPLAAIVVDADNNPVPNVSVKFTVVAGSTGASAAFASGATDIESTNASGVATTSQTLTANLIPGSFTVTASASGVTAPGNFTLQNLAVMSLPTGAQQQESTAVNTIFSPPLAALVTDANNNPLQGISVTFAAPNPGSGPSGTFQNGTNTETDVTNASGIVTATSFTANSSVGGPYSVTAAAGSLSLTFSLTNTQPVGPPASMSAQPGTTPQSATVSTAFPTPLAVLVVDANSNPVGGVSVTFTAPGSGASGTFQNTGNNVETDTTASNGVATASTFTANATTGGPYNVVATSGTLTPVDFSLTNKAFVLSSNNYVFYASGQEAPSTNNGNLQSYVAVAGALQIDILGNIVSGEQDYNDAHGITASDQIPAANGALVVNPKTGSGTLTINVSASDTKVGVNGVETFAVQFVNAKHALIMQFDGSATSSGSLDLQTPQPPQLDLDYYSFVLSGVDNSQSTYASFGFGGVYELAFGGSFLINGQMDVNDAAAAQAVVRNSAFSGPQSAPDSLGRGTIKKLTNPATNLPLTLIYYIVGPETLRIIDMDTTDAAVGSAYDQAEFVGSGRTSTLVQSVFELQGQWSAQYGALGQLTPTGGVPPIPFSGFAEDNEAGTLSPPAAISGNYVPNANGYGTLTINPGNLGSVSTLGIYMVDKDLNLNDPNNPSGTIGGGLLLDLDPGLPGGAGVVIPQTDTATASFAGSYAFAWQDFGGDGHGSACIKKCEADMLSVGSVSNLSLNAGGDDNDLFGVWTGTSGQSSNDSFGPTVAKPDAANPGRYSMQSNNSPPNPLAAKINGNNLNLNVDVYQASGDLLYWLETDTSGVFVGSIEQQGSLSGVPATAKRSGKAAKHQK